MNFICWNCRGAGRNLGSNKMQYLANLMSSTNAKVTFISETLSSKINSHDLVNRFSIYDSFIVPAKDRAGGLWVMWSDEVRLDITYASQNLVCASVVNTSTSFSFYLICVYGDPHYHSTKDIWGQIEAFVSSPPDKPVYCMGDFNNILNPDDKFSNAKPNHNRMNNFRHYVKRCGLIDIYIWAFKDLLILGATNAFLLFLLMSVLIDVLLMLNGARAFPILLFIICL